MESGCTSTRRRLDTPDFTGWAELTAIALSRLTPETMREQMLSYWPG